jgi:hypothetical protein
MADGEQNALVVQGQRSLAEVGAGPRSILSSVVSDALAVARSREKALAAARFRIGNYGFREPDYSQLLIWAKALEIEPEALVQQLEKTSFEYPSETKNIFTVEQGAIVSLAWDLKALPLKTFDWVRGLSIWELAVFGKEAEHPNISFSLPCLRWLFIGSIKLKKLDLSNVPNLTELSCSENQLTRLDLSHAPNLTKLDCYKNQLTRLDVSNVPGLTGLLCSENQLTEFDLSNVPNLTSLLCSENQLTKLDLSNVPNLTDLYCPNNQLTELDLSNVPGLTKLHCRNNRLTKLDVRANTALTELRCDPSVNVIKLPSQNFKR